MTPDFFKLSAKFMRDPIKILVKTDELTLEGIKQYYIDLERMIINMKHYVIFMH